MEAGSEQRRPLEPRPEPFGQRHLQPCQRLRRRLRQLAVAPARHDARAEDERFQLLGAEHQRREVEPLAEGVADARFALDGHARGDEVRDVPVYRPLRDLKVPRQRCGGHDRAAAQRLDHLEQPVGPPHRHGTMPAVRGIR